MILPIPMAFQLTSQRWWPVTATPTDDKMTCDADENIQKNNIQRGEEAIRSINYVILFGFFFLLRLGGGVVGMFEGGASTLVCCRCA
jgi:hypothetical protein